MAMTMLRQSFKIILLSGSLATLIHGDALTFYPLQTTRERNTISLTIPTSLIISKHTKSETRTTVLPFSSIVQEARARFMGANPLDTTLESEDYYRIGDYEEHSFTLPADEGAPVVTITIGATVVMEPWGHENLISWEFEQPSIEIQLRDTITHQAIAKYNRLPLLLSLWITESYKIICVQKLSR